MSAENNAAGTEAFPSPGGVSPCPQGRSSRERSEQNLSRVTVVKFCPYGQSEIRLAPGEITSCEPVKLLPSAAAVISLCRRHNFTIRNADNFTLTAR